MEYSVEYSVNKGSGFQTSFEYLLPLEASGFGILELQDWNILWNILSGYSRDQFCSWAKVDGVYFRLGYWGIEKSLLNFSL